MEVINPRITFVPVGEPGLKFRPAVSRLVFSILKVL